MPERTPDLTMYFGSRPRDDKRVRNLSLPEVIRIIPDETLESSVTYRKYVHIMQFI